MSKRAPMLPPQPHVASATAVTQPGMRAVRKSGARAVLAPAPALEESPTSRPLDYSFDDEDEVTSVARITVTGSPPVVLPQKAQPVLVRVDGPCAGQTVSLPPEGLFIGRGKETDLRVSDDGLSRRHARVFVDGDRFFVQDLGSTNGTYAGGKRIHVHALQNGDVVHLGPRVSFRFTLTDPQQARLLRQLFESSTRDALTGAHNRQHFDERLACEVAYSRRHETELSLVLLDIDHFKRVNDAHGHQGGDAALRHFSGLVQPRLRTEDIFARYGGEEFAVILRGIDRVGAARVGERLRSAISASPVYFAGSTIPMTVSAGAATIAELSEQTPEGLVKAADRRLYLAKNGGRNRVVSDG